MSKFQKALNRLLSRPSDLTYDELKMILTSFGYEEIMGKGSGRKFIHSETQHLIVNLHKPHPRPIIKMYIIKRVIEKLFEQNLI
jgi:predicted RNA binding protein YcfA (HicA-like mRNA interferase family)